MFMIRLLMRDDAGAIAVRAVIAQAWINGYRAAGAMEACTYAFGISMVTLGTDAGDATADGDGATDAIISATDACTEVLTLGCDGATCDANVATVILVSVLRPAANARSIVAARSRDNATHDCNVAAIAIRTITAADASTAFARIYSVIACA